jgi:hypothetical protein
MNLNARIKKGGWLTYKLRVVLAMQIAGSHTVSPSAVGVLGDTISLVTGHLLSAPLR